MKPTYERAVEVIRAIIEDNPDHEDCVTKACPFRDAIDFLEELNE